MFSTAVKDWQAPWADEPADPKYFVKAATVEERELFEAEAAAFRAARVFPWDLQNAFFDGLKALLPADPEEVERIQDINLRVTSGDEASAAELAELQEVTDALTEYWPGYRKLVEQTARREAIMPVLAVRRFLQGWERVKDQDGQDVPLKRGLDGRVTDGCMQHMDTVTIRSLGLFIYNALYAVGAEKNSVPPSKSGSVRKTSSRAGRGKSATTSGKKTQP